MYFGSARFFLTTHIQTPAAEGRPKMANRADDYKSCTQIEHVKLRPNLYVGAVVPTKVDAFLFDEGENKMVYRTDVPYCEGLVKIFNEAIDNAIDNSVIETDPTTTIKVTLTTDGVFSIKNDGRSIPVVPMQGQENKIVPQVIFGECLSGSNFGDNRESIGANGLGIKLANILSDRFSVTCFDKVSTKTFRGAWSNGMEKVEKSKVFNIKGGAFTTEVSFTPTLDRFQGNPDVILTSAADMAPWVLTRLVQLKATHPNPKLKVYFNGQMIKCKGFKAYMKMFPCEHTFYDKPAETFEYGISMSTTGQYEHQSFVNCQPTPSPNSTHTKYVTRNVIKLIREYLAKKNKGANTTLSSQHIQSKLNVFVNIRLKNPGFTSQTKTELSSPINPSDFPLNSGYILGVLKKSGVMEILEQALNAKVLDSMSKTLNANKSRNVVVEKYDSAHASGTKDSSKCTLFIVEGDSAKTMATIGFSVIGRKYYGVFPIRGKLLNVRGASPTVLKNNKEVQNIMKILGLNFSKKYNTADERATLRYGKLCVLTDADIDGHHITGLLLNFISFFWPELSPHFFVRFVTPIIKATKGKNSKHFFNTDEFETWRKSTSGASKWFVQHLKGLGTSERRDTVQYFKDLRTHLKTFTFSDRTMELTKNIFDPKETNWRKLWLTGRTDDEVNPLDYKSPVVPVDEFLNTELYEFSKADIVRSIPSVVDGFKKSQRQALCGSLAHFSTTKNQAFKVAQLAGIVAAKTKYAHGEVSLQDTIVGMAQDFAGSNNMPLFTTKGAFGSRMLNGKDAASARYIYTSLRSHTRDIFKEADDVILNYPLEEGSKVQPAFYVPTLPMLLLNGANGIGTGFATKLPCFKKEDVIMVVRQVVAGDENIRDPLPWYQGYRTNHLTRFDMNKWIFRGEFEYSPNKVTITEIPIGYSIEGYKEKVLDKLLDNKTINKYTVCHVDENNPRFEVTLGKQIEENKVEETFKLQTSIPASCMYFLNRNGQVRKYHSIADIVREWYLVKQEYTEKRRLAQIQATKTTLDDIQVKAKFIRAVVNDQIVLYKRTRENIKEQMLSVGIDESHHEKLLSMSLMSVTEERIAKLENEILTLQSTITALETTTATSMFLDDLGAFDESKKRSHEDDQSNANKKLKA